MLEKQPANREEEAKAEVEEQEVKKRKNEGTEGEKRLQAGVHGR